MYMKRKDRFPCAEANFCVLERMQGKNEIRTRVVTCEKKKPERCGGREEVNEFHTELFIEWKKPLCGKYSYF